MPQVKRSIPHPQGGTQVPIYQSNPHNNSGIINNNNSNNPNINNQIRDMMLRVNGSIGSVSTHLNNSNNLQSTQPQSPQIGPGNSLTNFSIEKEYLGPTLNVPHNQNHPNIEYNYKNQTPYGGGEG